MQTPVEIDFQDLAAPAGVRDSIEQHLAKLEQRFGRITAGRLVVKGPGGHHRTGLYDVNIRLALPDGREVNVGRTPKEDERYSDLEFAINDAFKRARRQLQDQVRRLQGQVKQHQAEPIGTVRHLDPSGEFGFIEAADGHEVYFHRNSVLDGAFGHLMIGSRVTYFEEPGEKGPQASTVKLVGKHGLRL
jgi:cold shock CspA family protein